MVRERGRAGAPNRLDQVPSAENWRLGPTRRIHARLRAGFRPRELPAGLDGHPLRRTQYDPWIPEMRFANFVMRSRGRLGVSVTPDHTRTFRCADASSRNVSACSNVSMEPLNSSRINVAPLGRSAGCILAVVGRTCATASIASAVGTPQTCAAARDPNRE